MYKITFWTEIVKVYVMKIFVYVVCDKDVKIFLIRMHVGPLPFRRIKINKTGISNGSD